MRAKPLIIWGLLAGVFVLPATALALGLGKLTVDSSLGQPLSAHVELTAAQKEELDSLAAKVADQSVYRDNNVAYPAALSRARVTIEQSANGPPQLKVTTQQAVNDPYLDLIVEVNWATGRVVRNYTFLLDPPGASEKQAVAPTAAAIRADAAPSRGARAERAERNAPAAAGPNAGQGDTYTVRRGDTLSKIAKVYKPENVSLEQMLVALLRSNEGAFEDKNMNRLRTGQILNVPPADQAASVTPNEAVRVVRVQAADWRTYRDRVAGAAPATEAGQTGQAAGGKITTAVEDKGAAAQPGKDQLRLSREAGKGAGAAQVEDFAAKDKALRDANSRIADLEKTLQNMQKAAELKSQTMADLQKQAEAAKAKAAEAAKAAPPQIAAAPSATAPPAVPPVTSAPSTTSPAPAAVIPLPAPVSPPAAAPESKAVVPAAPETKAPDAKAPETNAPETKAPATKVAPVTPKATKAEPSRPDRRSGCRAPPDGDQVRGQHHLRYRYQDQHRLRFDRRRCGQYRRQLARERFQPRGPGEHRHRRGRPDRGSGGLSRLRSRCAGRGNPQGSAEKGRPATGDLPQVARDPRAAQQAVGVRDGRQRTVFGFRWARRSLAEGDGAGSSA